MCGNTMKNVLGVAWRGSYVKRGQFGMVGKGMERQWEKERRCLRMAELFIPAVIRQLNSGVLPFVMCKLN